MCLMWWPEKQKENDISYDQTGHIDMCPQKAYSIDCVRMYEHFITFQTRNTQKGRWKILIE